MKNLKDFKSYSNNKKNTVATGKIKLKVLLSFSALIIALIFVQMIFSSNVAIDGQKLSNVNSEIKNLESENNKLRVAIAKESSFSNLTVEAKELGFGRPENIIGSI